MRFASWRQGHEQEPHATAVFCAIIAIGFLMSPVIAISVDVARGASAAGAIGQWSDHLFLPGYNEFALCVMGAAPFLITAVFSWLHLKRGAGQGRLVLRARFTGVAGAVVAGAALSIWVMAGVRLSRSSTAVIAYLFLPFYVLFAMPIGYAAGRVIARLRRIGPG